MKSRFAALAVTVCLTAAACPAGPVGIGAKAPEIKLKTAGGDEVSLSGFAGKKNVLLMFLKSGGSYVGKPGSKLPYVARPVKRLHYERARLAGYEAEAIVIHPGPVASGVGTDAAIATTLHDPTGQAYAAYGLAGGSGKGSWAAFFIDKKGVIRLRYLAFDWQTRKKTGLEHADLLDIYADVEKHLGLWTIPKDARVARFQQGVSPAGYSGCTGLQIWPRYKKSESLAKKQTAFVRSWTGGEFIIIQFQDIVGTGGGRIPARASIRKAYLRLTTINHASTQKVTVHRMTTPWDVNARFQRSAVKDGKDIPWKQPGLGKAGANFEAKPVTEPSQVPINYGDVEWDITPAVQEWVNGKANHGLAVLAEKGTKTPDHACFAMGPFFRAGQRPQLIVYYTSGKRSAPSDPSAEAKADALLKSAKAFRKMGVRTKARQMLQQIVDEYPNTAAAREAARLIAEK